MDGSSLDAPALGAAWSRLRSQTRSKLLPQCLVAMFYALGLLADTWRPHSEGSSFPADGRDAVFAIAGFAAGVWFYGIVLVGLWRARPVGRSPAYEAVNLWLLFLGYTVWLAFFPPSRSRRVIDWMAWIAVLLGLALVLFPIP